MVAGIEGIRNAVYILNVFSQFSAASQEGDGISAA